MAPRPARPLTLVMRQGLERTLRERLPERDRFANNAPPESPVKWRPGGYVWRMARFEARNVSEADVAASRDEIWALVTSPESLAQLTPLIEHINAEGDQWCWQLKSISALGVHVKPSFTEHMSFEEERRITFEHRPPPGKPERAGAAGVYALDDGPEGGTHLAVDITLHVELPLPAVSRRAVERVMVSTMARTGERFAANLYARLGVVARHTATPSRASR